MKFIKFSMQDKKDDFTLPMEKAEQILTSSQQTIMVLNEGGSWSGIFVNKAYIKKTDRDYDAEREWKMKNPSPALAEPEGTPVTPEYMARISGEVKKILKNKHIV